MLKTKFGQIRMRPDMHAKIKAEADANARSMSEEIEFRLNRSFRDDEVLARLARIESALAHAAAHTVQQHGHWDHHSGMFVPHFSKPWSPASPFTIRDFGHQHSVSLDEPCPDH